jgi:hypothetical protein
MIVRWKNTEHCFEVYSILWVDNRVQFYLFPKNHSGLTAFGDDEVDVVDPAIGSEFEFVQFPSGHSGLVHRHMLQDALFDRLIEHDQDAVREFYSLVANKTDH